MLYALGAQNRYAVLGSARAATALEKKNYYGTTANVAKINYPQTGSKRNRENSRDFGHVIQSREEYGYHALSYSLREEYSGRRLLMCVSPILS